MALCPHEGTEVAARGPEPADTVAAMSLTLLDWRRRVAALYAAVRAARDPEAGWRTWRAVTTLSARSADWRICSSSSSSCQAGSNRPVIRGEVVDPGDD